MKKLAKISLMILIVTLTNLVMSGCPSIAKTAYETAVGAKAFTEDVKANHSECVVNGIAQDTHTQVCSLLFKTIAAKDVLIDVGEEFCSGGNFGNIGIACNPPKKGDTKYQILLDKLTAAVANYNKIASDLQKVK